MNIDKPIYLQLAELLENKIFNKKYRPGSALPSERELCETYGISRMTVRKAIGVLVDKDILTRIQGKGTFVNRIDINASLDGIESMRAFIREEGLLPSNRVIYSTVRPAGKKYSKIFGIKHEDMIFFLHRLRLANGKPIAMEYTHVPYDLIPNLDEHDFETESLYDLFEKYGFHLAKDQQLLEIVRISSPQSNLLELDEGSPVFMLNNTVTATSGKVIEHTHSYIDQNAMTFTSTLIL